MTGMPAFGETHDDATLWNIAGFVKALPTMSASRYAAYEAEEDVAGHHHEAGEETAADHAHPPGTPPHED